AVSSSQHTRRKRCWCPDTDLRVEKLKASRHDTNNSIFFVIEQNVAANQPRIPTVSRTPKRIADNCYLAGLRLVVIQVYRAANFTTHSENREEVSGDAVCVDFFRLSVTGEVEISDPQRGHVFENLIARFPVDVVGRRGSILGEVYKRCVL